MNRTRNILLFAAIMLLSVLMWTGSAFRKSGGAEHSREGIMGRLSPVRLAAFVLILLAAAMAAVSMATPVQAAEPRVPLRAKWTVQYPLSKLYLLPLQSGTFAYQIGYLSDAARWARVSRAAKPGSPVPEVDFNTEIVIYLNPFDPVNQIGFMRLERRGDILVIVWVTSAMGWRLGSGPAPSKTMIAFAIVPKLGVKYLDFGRNRRLRLR